MGKETPVGSHNHNWRELEELALDLRWSWQHDTDIVWRELSPALWELTRNPWVVLQTVARDKLARLLENPAWHAKVDALVQANRQNAMAPAWFQQAHAHTPLSSVAYFSMEFMLSEALPIYSGGLGNVAGDQLKAASDLGVPVVAIGLLYQQGYFRQVIDKGGRQQALYPYNDPGQLPITPLRRADGEWLRLEIPLPGWPLWLRTWQVQVGRVKLYLLDSNDAANYSAHRGITSELYGGDAELRLKQELVLGIGGWRLLEALGIHPEVCHLNEGHAAFAILERAKSYMAVHKVPFEVALAATRVGNLFTTHTAVAAGFDRFPAALVEQYLGDYARQQLGISVEQLLALGRQEEAEGEEPFNMAYLAVRGSGAVNGVSQLHGEVSRHIFAPLFPRWPADEVPVGSVTNGVHMPSWDSAAADALWTDSCGKRCWQNDPQLLAETMRGISDDKLWQMRQEGKRALVTYARRRLARQVAARGASSELIEEINHYLRPDILTLGFARRFATYKRPNLLLSDPERLVRLLTSQERPVQLLIAGKAHPADLPGQALIEEWMQFIFRPEVRPHVIFLADYDMLLTEYLVQGVDVWINTPERPWEACGTSGMKVLVNGGLNLSELDGWWAEAYQPTVGWALGDGRDHGEDHGWGSQEASELYYLLEKEVIPEFYDRDSSGLPRRWLERMRESMATLAPRFSATRAVREYTESYYLPAAKRYLERCSQQTQIGRSIATWQQQLQKYWPQLRFDWVHIASQGDHYQGTVQLFLGELDPSLLQVELYAEFNADHSRECHVCTLTSQLPEAIHVYVYQVTLPNHRPSADYTARVVPAHSDAQIPLEAPYILWQH